MYGLTHRLPRIAGPELDLEAASVLVIDRDPLTLRLVREAVSGSHHVVVARDAEEAMSLMEGAFPDAVVLDSGLDDAEVALITIGMAACETMDAVPTVMIDLDQPINADAIRARIDAALRVTRRVYLGGGLRHRVGV